jgi:tRNA (guanine26-N2/guanine27-N2)-dimethyltransferase
MPFYNPSMAIARDMSVLVQERVAPRKFGDVLAATGALGLRVAREAAPPEVLLCDHNPRAVALIKANASLNELAKVRILHEDARALMATEIFDSLELDPYGSPVPFVDAALPAVRSRGILGCTATDTALLMGARAQACRRRYQAEPLRCPFAPELGLRILLAFLARSAAKVDVGVEPILAYAAEHFLKVYVRATRGASRADAALGRLVFVQWDPVTGHRSLIPELPRGTQWAGPLWGGPLGEASLLSSLAPRDYMGAHTGRLLEFLRGEIALPPLYYTTDELARLLRTSPPPLQAVLDALAAQGIPAARTHLHPRGIRLAGTTADILSVFRGLTDLGRPKGHGEVPPGET